MKKVEFDCASGRFVVESDDNNSEEFIKEYTEIFFEKLSAYKGQMRVAEISGGNSSGVEHFSEDVLGTGCEATCDDVIPLFNVSSKQLAYLIDFSNDGIKIIVRNKILKGTKAEMQVKIALLYCGACEYKGVKANTKDIRSICNSYQCLDGNFAQNIKRDNYFNISGAVNADIVLTMPGKDKLIDIVSEILSSMEIA